MPDLFDVQVSRSSATAALDGHTRRLPLSRSTMLRAGAAVTAALAVGLATAPFVSESPAPKSTPQARPITDICNFPSDIGCRFNPIESTNDVTNPLGP